MIYKIISVPSNEQSLWTKSLQHLEGVADYPFGNDSFKIDHGLDYFAFFNRLGMTKFNLAIHDNQVIACGAAILRKINNSNVNMKAWYLCDLKVHPDFKGNRIPSQLFKKNIFWNYLKCSSAYAISMNPANGPNKVIRLLEKFSWLPFKKSAQLNFYTLTYEQVLDLEGLLLTKLGHFSFFSLAGQKDLIMKSTGNPMPLLHFQHGPFADKQAGTPRKEHLHMFCAPEGSLLDNLLCHRFKPDATASIITHRMPYTDWNFILSSDI